MQLYIHYARVVIQLSSWNFFWVCLVFDSWCQSLAMLTYLPKHYAVRICNVFMHIELIDYQKMQPMLDKPPFHNTCIQDRIQRTLRRRLARDCHHRLIIIINLFIRRTVKEQKRNRKRVRHADPLEPCFFTLPEAHQFACLTLTILEPITKAFAHADISFCVRRRGRSSTADERVPVAYSDPMHGRHCHLRLSSRITRTEPAKHRPKKEGHFGERGNVTYSRSIWLAPVSRSCGRGFGEVGGTRASG